MVSCDDIARAHERIQEQAKRTPVLTSATVNARFISTQTGAGCMPIVSGRGSSSSWCFTPLFDKVAAKVVGKRKFRFKNKLVSIDSTTIDLCLSMFDWAKFTCTKE